MITAIRKSESEEGIGVRAKGRAAIAAKTLRLDTWWVLPTVTVVVLLSFILYSSWRAFSGVNYYSSPLISPFYSPCLSTKCVPGSADFGTPFGDWFPFSPALIILIVPLGFRLTCYYYRKAYYRSFWMSPPACAVAEPHKRYSGETRFPLIFQNVHRWFLYIAVLFNICLTYDVIISMRNPEHEWFHVSVGTLVLAVNAFLLWCYTLSCHSCRHAMGGRLKHFSKHPIRYRAWTWISKLNTRHPMFAWLSLFSVGLADLYVMLCAQGTITNFYFF